MEEANRIRAGFCLFVQTNSNRAHDVLVDRGHHLVQQPLHSGDLRIHRLYLVPHTSPIDGRGGEPGELSKYTPDIPGPMTLEDPGAGASSPRVAFSGMPAPVPRTTKSCDKLPALPPSQGPASATSTPVAPCGAPPAPGTSIADATTGHQRATGTDEACLMSQ
jgi:hypothetical protein